MKYMHIIIATCREMKYEESTDNKTVLLHIITCFLL